MGSAINKLTAQEIVDSPAWEVIKSACLTLRGHQVHDGSIPEKSVHKLCGVAVASISSSLREIASQITHDKDYLLACADDFDAWAN